MAAVLAAAVLVMLLEHAAAASSAAAHGDGALVSGNATAGDAPRSAAVAVAAGGCPAWLAEYAAFHATARNDPSAKFLIWTCNLEHRPGASRYVLGNDCNGLGDRLRGIMWMVRAAAAAGRVLLAMERMPAPLEAYLEPPPGGIDWRTSPELEAYTLEVANAAAPGRVRHTHHNSEARSPDHKQVRACRDF